MEWTLSNIMLMWVWMNSFSLFLMSFSKDKKLDKIINVFTELKALFNISPYITFLLIFIILPFCLPKLIKTLYSQYFGKDKDRSYY